MPPSSATTASAPAAATAPPAYGRAIVLLSLCSFASSASMRLNDAMLPRLAADFGVALAAAAQVTSVFAVAYGLALPCLAPLGERFGKLRFIAGAALASALAALFCAAAPGLTALLWTRALAGAAAASIIPLSMAWIGDVFPYEGRQQVLARFLIGQIVGLAAGVWLGGLAADYTSWRVPYGVLAAGFALAGLALLRLERRLPAHARERRAAGGSALAAAFTDFARVLQVPWARVILACVFLEGLLLYGPFAFVASHLHDRYGIALSVAGSLVMLFALGGLAFAVGSARLVRALGEAGLATGGAAVLCATWALIAFAPAWPVAAVGIGLSGVGFYMLHNTLQVNATQMAPARRGAAVGAFAAAFFMGQSAGVALAGMLMPPLGGTAVMAASGVGLLAVGLAFTAARARHLRAAATESG